MSLAVLAYLVVSVLGIGGVFALLRRLGHASDGETDEGAARALAAAQAQLSGEARREGGAWLFPAEGGVVVVRSLGSHPVASLVRGGEVRSVKARPGALVLRLGRFEEPNITVATEAPGDLRRWLAAQGVADGAAG